MRLKLIRYRTSKTSSLGIFYIDDVFECFTLEDTARKKKIPGETRIPADIYIVKLRKSGGYHKKYSSKFPDIHKGMLWIQNIANFEWVYFHIGNTIKDTKACILVGNGVDLSTDMITQSTDAYKKMYPKVANAIEDDEQVVLEIIDYN